MIRLLQLLFGWLQTRKSPATGEYTLVVVDMQPGFSSSLDPATLAAVEREILAAMRLRNPIVLLEYRSYDETNKVLTAHLTGRYDLFATKTKGTDDGSKEVLQACKEKGFTTQLFRVC